MWKAVRCASFLVKKPHKKIKWQLRFAISTAVYEFVPTFKVCTKSLHIDAPINRTPKQIIHPLVTHIGQEVLQGNSCSLLAKLEIQMQQWKVRLQISFRFREIFTGNLEYVWTRHEKSKPSTSKTFNVFTITRTCYMFSINKVF